MNIIDDFKSLRRKVDRMDQKAEHEAQNPPPPAWYSKPVVWTPERGIAAPKTDAA
jgi:hypothetical protein